MTELVLERVFASDPETVFDHLTRPELVLQWWGPESMHIPEHQLDLTKPGPWSSTMVNAEGGRYKVSGEVLSLDPPNSIEFTWAWHDESDQRGHDSIVKFEVKAAENGSHFRMTHSGLIDEESANGHEQGWSSAYKKLERMLN